MGGGTDDRGASGTAGTAGVETSEQDAFAAGWDEAIEADKPPDQQAADISANLFESDNGTAGTAGTETLDIVEDAGTAGTAGIPASERQPGESDEKWEQRYLSLQGIHKHDKQTWETEKAQLLGELEEAKKPKPAEKKEATAEEKAAAEKFIDSLTDEQKQELESYQAEFDVVSRMEGLQRTVALNTLRKEIEGWKTEILGRIAKTEETLTPITSKVAEDEKEAHFLAIRQGYVAEDGTKVNGHPDYQTYVDNGAVEEWIRTFPVYLQASFKKVLAKGTAEEVIDLFTRFKEANNIPNISSTEDHATVIQLSEKKAQRKAALAAVNGRRGAVNLTQADTEDFDGAWDEANQKGGG
jgi:hypothetical protein